MEPVNIPKFSSESEEADWWFQHPDVLLHQFEQAAADGTLGRGRAMRRALAHDGVIQLDAEDASKAREVAARKGISVQSYVQTLIHEALERDVAA